MKNILAKLCCFLLVALPLGSVAQDVVKPNGNHEELLASTDTRAAANKRLVYDFWREVLEAGHLELAEKYLADGYIQHNPNVPSGRAGFVSFFSKLGQPKPIDPRVEGPLVAIISEGDLVVLSFVQEIRDPKGGTTQYTTTWFDMFRVTDGKITEHWDAARKQ